MQHAKIQAQQVNEAYAILIDDEKRAAYDQKLSDKRMANYQAEIRRQRSRDPDVQRRTVKTRRHRTVKQPKSGALPWIFFAGLVIFSLIVFSGFTRIATFGYYNIGSSRHVPRHPTAVGVISAYDLQITQDVINATNVVRTKTADDPTITPLSPEQYERSADRLFERGLISSALDAYSRAIQFAPDEAHLYYKRGLAYVAYFEEGTVSASPSAIADFDRALELDADYVDVYRERGLHYFDMWSQGDDTAGELALADLEQYQLSRTTPDETVATALNQLREMHSD